MAIVINSAWDAQVFEREREKARQSINSAWDAKVFYETYGGNGQMGNWGSPQWAAKRASFGDSTYYTYSPAAREWKKSSASSFSTSGFKSSATMSAGALSFSPSSTGAVSQAGVVNGQSDAATDSKTEAEKEYIDIEFNTLTGEMSLIPTKDNMKIKTNTTIRLNGVGKYLSGLYFVSEVKRTLTADGGYTLSIGLYKNGFGESLKSGVVVVQPTNTGRPTEVNTQQNIVQNKIKVGDKVKIVGDNAIYSNAHEGVKVPDWVKTQTLTVDTLSDDGLRARLNPIWSWTYVKFLQLV